MKLSQVVDSAKELLDSSLQNAYHNWDGAEDVSIDVSLSYRLARHIGELASDYLLLEEKGGFHGSPIILRSMLETLFSLGAIRYDKAFAGRRCVNELNEIIRKLKACANSEADSFDSELESDLVRLRTRICKHYSISCKSEKMRIKGIARLAKMEKFYEFQYSWLCQATHPTLIGTIEGESGGTSGHRGSTFAFILASTTAFLVQNVKIDDSQGRIDEATAIIEAVAELNESGLVDLMNKTEVDLKVELTSYLNSQSSHRA